MWVGGGWVAQQNRVTPSPFDFGLSTLDLDCDNSNDARYYQNDKDVGDDSILQLETEVEL